MNNEDYQIQELDVNNIKLRSEFESALFNAYKKDAGWYYNHFNKTDDKRLVPCLPYDDLRIAIVMYQGVVSGGMLSNINNKKKFLIEDMGFKLDRTFDSCEGMNTFISDNVPAKDRTNLMIKLGDFASGILAREKIHIVYAAPQVKYVNMHQWIFEYDEELEILEVEGEERQLLKKIF